MSAYDLTLGEGPGAIRFDGGAGVSTLRHGWGLTSLSDWMSLSDAKNSISERAMEHGAFDPGATLRTSAVISATVAYFADSVAELEEALRSLTGLAASPETMLRATFEGAAGSTHREVSNIEVGVPAHRGRTRLEGITIDMSAIDPRAYGETRSESTGVATHGLGVAYPLAFPADWGAGGPDGRVRFTNEGTAPTFLTFTVTGGMGRGFSLKRVETGQTLTLSRPIGPEDTVSMESYYGTVLLDGQSSLSGFLTRYDWFQCPPGQTCTVQFTPLGDIEGQPTLTMSAGPAWW